MAATSQKAPGKTDEAPHEKKTPAFNIRVKVEEATRNSKAIWMTVGVMFEADLGNGKKGYSIRFNSIPPGWKGDALAMPPLADKDEA